MKTNIQCPNCQGKHVHTDHKTTQIFFGIGMLLLGIGFLIPAVTSAVGYYFFALPLCTVGSIRAYKGYYTPVNQAHCRDCNHQFEYWLN